MREKLVRKIFILALTGLFVGIYIPYMSVGGNSNNTIYVDDDNISGPWDGTSEHPYRFIQQAIDNATDGDTIFVYHGTYYENIIVNTSLTLIGENRDTTIIDGGEKDDVITINADYVNISHFTVRNSGDHKAGIHITANHNAIFDNNIRGNYRGIFADISHNNIISYNFVTKNEEGILVMLSRNNLITQNRVESNGYGIYTRWGFLFNGCLNTKIVRNSVINNINGVFLNGGSNTTVNFNNFMNNNRSASFFMEDYPNWNNNYWDRPRFFPKIIIGINGFFIFRFPWVNFDWHPAKEPYEI